MRQFNCISTLAAVATFVFPIHALVSNNSINSQTRLAYAGTTGMMVSWNTFSQISNPTVHYGLSPHDLDQVASSTVSVTYHTSLTYNNHVKITGLKADTVYYYMPTTLIQDNSTTAPYSFRTSKPAGDKAPYSIAVVVDMGTMGPEGLYTSAGKGVAENNVLKPGEINTIQSLTSAVDQFEFLWHPGDIAYADAWLKEEIQGFEPNTTIEDGYKVYESILEEYYDEMTPITTSKSYMVGPGNHEANCDNGGTGGYNASICMPGQTNFTGYINHFRMPSAESGGTGNFWYSFDFGMTHYVQYDTETDLGHGLIGPDEPAGGTEDSGPFALMNAQANWLAADLAAVDRSKTPWIVVAGHRPWYSSGSICTACQSAFEAVFIENNVDLVLSGHFHVYARNAPIKNGTVDANELNNPSSPWYITNGAAGHYDGLDSFTLPLESYQRFGLSTSDGIYGWSKLTFHNCSHLTHEFINSANGSILDTATLFKDRDCGSGTESSSSVTSLPTSATSKASGSATSLATSSVPMTTSVIYTTTLITVISCAPTVTACPARSTQVITSTIALYTTVCPVSAAAVSTNPAVSSSAKSVASTAMPASSAGTTTISPAGSAPAEFYPPSSSTVAVSATVVAVASAGGASSVPANEAGASSVPGRLTASTSAGSEGITTAATGAGSGAKTTSSGVVPFTGDASDLAGTGLLSITFGLIVAMIM